MLMTDGEILKSYNEAKRKTKQVGVLADLNGCSRKEMAAHRTTLGAEVPEGRRGGRRTAPAGGGTPAGSLAALLGDLCRRYPEARVRAGSGEINAVTVTTRYRLDGSEDWTEIRLDAVASRSRG